MSRCLLQQAIVTLVDERGVGLHLYSLDNRAGSLTHGKVEGFLPDRPDQFIAFGRKKSNRHLGDRKESP